MSTDAFRRARKYVNRRSSLKWVSLVSGFAAGALYACWMLLFVLFVELLLSSGQVRVSSADAEYATQLTGSQAVGLEMIYSDAGILPVVIATRDHWVGPIAAWIYRTQPWTHSNQPYLIGLFLVGLIIGAARALLLYVQSVGAIAAVTGGLTDLQRELFRHEFDIGVQATHLGGGSPIGTLLREKVPQIHQALHLWLDTVSREPVKIVLLLAIVLILNPFLGLSFLLMIALTWILGTAIVHQNLVQRKQLAAASEGELQRLLGIASKLRLIKGYAAEDYFREQYDQHLAKFEGDNLRRLKYEGRVLPFWQFLGLLVIFVVVALGAHNVLTEKFSLSSAAGVYACLLSIVLPVGKIFQCRQAIHQADKAAKQVFDFLDQEPRIQQISGASFLEPLSKQLEFDKVIYRDSTGRLLIDNLSIRIHAGQKIAILSKTEEERLAFVMLLNRFIDPTSGTIRFDNTDIRSVTLESLRSQTCPVLQSDLLFPDSVAQNIGCGDPGYSLQKIIEAAKVAHAHNFIQRLPHGYDCLVGEAGFPLKVDEQYRIALARAILRDPPIAVIEEPYESLGEDVRALLDDTLARFCEDRTVIFLPRHRSTLRICHQIFLLENGRLAGCGTHKELSETSDLYRHLEYTNFYGVPSRV